MFHTRKGWLELSMGVMAQTVQELGFLGEMQKQSYVEDIKGIFKVEPNKQTKDNQKTNRKYNIVKIEQQESHQKPGWYKQNDM